MGSCCSNMESVTLKETDKPKKKNIPKMKTKQNKSQIFISKIDELIEKNKHLEQIQIKKFSIPHLWNLFKYYPELTNSNYILVNLNDKEYFTNVSNKIQNINEIIEENAYKDENAIESLRKYVDLKNLLIILDLINLKKLDKLLDYFTLNKFRCLIFILDYDISNDSDIMINLINSKSIVNYPFCLISYNKFKNLESKGYLFLENSSKLINIENFINQEKEYDSFKFFNYFNLELIFEIFKENNEDQKDTKKLKRIYCNLQDINDLGDLIKKKIKINKIIEIIMNKLGMVKENNNNIKSKENSILIVFNNSVDYEVKIYIIFILFNKLFNLVPYKIKNYMIYKMFYIIDIKTYLSTNYSKIVSFLEKNYDYLAIETKNIKAKVDSLEDLIFIKDKFNYFLSILKKQVDNTSFNKCIDLIDKIISNIIMHPKEEKYYRIKASSEALKEFVLSNENSTKVLEQFGFIKSTINDVEYFKLNEDININYLKGLNFDFKEVIKKLV